MRKGIKGLLAVVAACAMFSMTALAEEELELTEIIVSPESEEEVGAVGGHGTILLSAELLDVYSNNTKIELKVFGRSTGNQMETYEIAVYRGVNITDKSDPLAGTTRDFPENGDFRASYTLDTTDTGKYTEGKYTVVCTSYYREGGARVKSSQDSAVFEIEDYRRVKDREFVSRLYQKVFGRAGDDAGLKDWTDRLFTGRTTGATTVEGFFESAEFTQKNTSDEQYIELLYEAIFSRTADAQGRQNWLDVLGEGVSRKYILRQFVNSAEFNNLCRDYGIQQGDIVLTENRDKNLQVTGFVGRLYRIALGRSADQAGINDWTGRLINKKETPKQVAKGFIFSAEVNKRQLDNTEFVTLLYRTMMGREPDNAGLQDWVGRLDKGTAKREDVYNGFADSAEFGKIVADYGL